MYLCIGTLLKLIDIFSNGAYTKLEICQELFSFADSDYDKRDASELINCNRNIKKHERNHILSFNLQNDRQYNRLHAQKIKHNSPTKDCYDRYPYKY